jgi:ABC-type lipoprotein release transport system permease subunit
MKYSKHLVFWSIASRNIIRFPGKTLAVLIPLFAVMAVASAMTFIKDGLLKDALCLAGTLPDISVQQVAAGRASLLSSDLLGAIADYPNVRKVSPRIWGYVPAFTSGRSLTYTLMGIDSAKTPLAQDISLTIEKGRFLGPADKDCAVVGDIFAKQNMVDPGDKISVKDEFGNESLFNIIGIFGSDVQIYSADLIVTDIDSARKFFGLAPGQFSDLSVYLEDPALSGQTAFAIQTSGKNIKVLTKDDLTGIIKRGYSGKSGVFQLMWMILLLTVLLLSWTQAGSFSLEMKKEIGVLKALGWQTLDIIELKMMETMIIGFLGIFGGVLFGVFYLHIGAPLIKEYFLGWALVYPEFKLPVYMDPSSLFLLFVVGLLPLSAATVIPAWLMGTLEPDNAIRSN